MGFAALPETHYHMQNETPSPLLSIKSSRFASFRSRPLLLILLLPVFYNNWAAETVDEEEFRIPNDALLHAHAHNDYRHEKPLWEALSRGFSSVEADVHLVNGELYLGHWFPRISASQTLRKQYLEPLNALVTRQQGRVYPGFEGVFYLMVDIKTEAAGTYAALRRLLLQYPALRTSPNFRVFVSGNRAVQQILEDTDQVVAVDGRLPDLSRLVNSRSMPVISDNFRQYFRWRGNGPMPAAEWERLRTFAEAAHRQGKKLRFWAAPDQPLAWETLLNAGVDLINTDDLRGLEMFLLARQDCPPSSMPEMSPVGGAGRLAK